MSGLRGYRVRYIAVRCSCEPELVVRAIRSSVRRVLGDLGSSQIRITGLDNPLGDRNIMIVKATLYDTRLVDALIFCVALSYVRDSEGRVNFVTPVSMSGTIRGLLEKFRRGGC